MSKYSFKIQMLVIDHFTKYRKTYFALIATLLTTLSMAAMAASGANLALPIKLVSNIMLNNILVVGLLAGAILAVSTMLVSTLLYKNKNYRLSVSRNGLKGAIANNDITSLKNWLNVTTQQPQSPKISWHYKILPNKTLVEELLDSFIEYQELEREDSARTIKRKLKFNQKARLHNQTLSMWLQLGFINHTQDREVGQREYFDRGSKKLTLSQRLCDKHGKADSAAVVTAFDEAIKARIITAIAMVEPEAEPEPELAPGAGPKLKADEPSDADASTEASEAGQSEAEVFINPDQDQMFRGKSTREHAQAALSVPIPVNYDYPKVAADSLTPNTLPEHLQAMGMNADCVLDQEQAQDLAQVEEAAIDEALLAEEQELVLNEQVADLSRLHDLETVYEDEFKEQRRFDLNVRGRYKFECKGRENLNANTVRLWLRDIAKAATNEHSFLDLIDIRETPAKCLISEQAKLMLQRYGANFNYKKREQADAADPGEFIPKGFSITIEYEDGTFADYSQRSPDKTVASIKILFSHRLREEQLADPNYSDLQDIVGDDPEGSNLMVEYHIIDLPFEQCLQPRGRRGATNLIENGKQLLALMHEQLKNRKEHLDDPGTALPKSLSQTELDQLYANYQATLPSAETYVEYGFGATGNFIVPEPLICSTVRHNDRNWQSKFQQLFAENDLNLPGDLEDIIGEHGNISFRNIYSRTGWNPFAGGKVGLNLRDCIYKIAKTIFEAYDEPEQKQAKFAEFWQFVQNANQQLLTVNSTKGEPQKVNFLHITAFWFLRRELTSAFAVEKFFKEGILNKLINVINDPNKLGLFAALGFRNHLFADLQGRRAPRFEQETIADSKNQLSLDQLLKTIEGVVTYLNDNHLPPLNWDLLYRFNNEGAAGYEQNSSFTRAAALNNFIRCLDLVTNKLQLVELFNAGSLNLNTLNAARGLLAEGYSGVHNAMLLNDALFSLSTSKIKITTADLKRIRLELDAECDRLKATDKDHVARCYKIKDDIATLERRLANAVMTYSARIFNKAIPNLQYPEARQFKAVKYDPNIPEQYYKAIYMRFIAFNTQQDLAEVERQWNTIVSEHDEFSSETWAALQAYATTFDFSRNEPVSTADPDSTAAKPKIDDTTQSERVTLDRYAATDIDTLVAKIGIDAFETKQFRKALQIFNDYSANELLHSERFKNYNSYSKFAKEILSSALKDLEGMDRNNPLNPQLMKFLAKLRVAIWLQSGGKIALRLEQIMVIMLGLNHDRLIQAETSEGKTLINQLLAIVKAACGQKVDVITHAKEFAQRDCEPLFRRLGHDLGLNICHNYDGKGTSEHLACDIFYIDIYKAVLTTIDNKHKGVEHRRADVAIIDEVDNITIDIDATTTLQSASTRNTGMDASVLADFYQALIKVAAEIHADPTANTKELQLAKLSNHISDEPNEFFASLGADEIWSWLKSAITAHNFQLDVDYTIAQTIDPHATAKTAVNHQIHIMHKDTSGREDKESRWGKGIHQLIAMREQLRLDDIDGNRIRIEIPELTLVAADCSVQRYLLDNYKSRIGLTGTIGAEPEQEIQLRALGLIDDPANSTEQASVEADANSHNDEEVLYMSSEDSADDTTKYTTVVKMPRAKRAHPDPRAQFWPVVPSETQQDLSQLAVVVNVRELGRKYELFENPNTPKEVLEHLITVDIIAREESKLGYRYNRRMDFKPTLAADRNEQYAQLLTRVRQHHQANDSMVVFFSTIAECNDFYQFVLTNAEKHGIAPDKLQIFDDTAASEDPNAPPRKPEAVFLAQSHQPGFITIATAAAGRGTNLKEVEALAIAKPSLLRVKDQEIARVGRNGRQAVTYRIFNAEDFDFDIAAAGDVQPAKPAPQSDLSSLSIAEAIITPWQERKQQVILDRIKAKQELNAVKAELRSAFYEHRNNAGESSATEQQWNQFYSQIDSKWAAGQLAEVLKLWQDSFAGTSWEQEPEVFGRDANNTSSIKIN